MIVIPKELGGRGRLLRGVHPPVRKETLSGKAIEVLPVPAQVDLPVLQHAGAPCEPCVAPRETVTMGQKIAGSDAFISAPVHASLNGKMQRPGVTTLPNGRHVTTLPITAEGDQLEGRALFDDLYGGTWETDGVAGMDPEWICNQIHEAGIVGQGGAAFPTYVKLLRNAKKPVDTLLVNGCECEPYLTADERLMIEVPEAIIAGALIAAQAAGVQRIVVAVEENTPEAAAAVRKAAGSRVLVALVQARYPMGGEKQTVRAVLDRIIPTGGLPLDVGVVVINVATSAAIARAVLRNKPLTHRVIAVTGSGIRNPRNLLAPVGASYRELVEFCGGLTPDAARVIAGGPMMGFALSDLDVPVTKGTSGIVAITEAEVRRSEETPCVRCGRCVEVCPLNLIPTKLAMASRQGDWDLAQTYHLRACMECGCCAYSCPARIPLVQLMRMGKAEMLKSQAQAKK